MPGTDSRNQVVAGTSDEAHPRAESALSIVCELAPSIAAQPLTQVVLRGFSLTTRADPDKQGGRPWNSNGMWPYHMSIALSPVRAGAFGVEVKMHRAWTPNKGGIPGIETKALTPRLDFDLTVHYTMLGGAAGQVAFSRGAEVIGSDRGHDREPVIEQARIDGIAGMAHAAIGMTSFGFTLGPPTSKERHRHLGRYLAALGFRVGLADYLAERGQANVHHRSRVWLPRTVIDAEVSYVSRAVLIQLAEGSCSDGQVAVGSICSESAPEAPFFSRWKRCGGARGPAGTEDAVSI